MKAQEQAQQNQAGRGVSAAAAAEVEQLVALDDMEFQQGEGPFELDYRIHFGAGGRTWVAEGELVLTWWGRTSQGGACR